MSHPHPSRVGDTLLFCSAFIVACLRHALATYLLHSPHSTSFGVGLLKYRAAGTSVFPCSEFKTDLRHSFWPFSKLIEACDTLFTRFQNHLALATLFSPPFDFKTPRCNSAKPCFHSERPFRNLRNLVSFSKHPFAPLQHHVSIPKHTFAPLQYLVSIPKHTFAPLRRAVSKSFGADGTNREPAASEEVVVNFLSVLREGKKVWTE